MTEMNDLPQIQNLYNWSDGGMNNRFDFITA